MTRACGSGRIGKGCGYEDHHRGPPQPARRARCRLPAQLRLERPVAAGDSHHGGGIPLRHGGLNTWTHEPEGAFTYQVGDGDVWFSDVIGEGAYLHFARFTDGEGEYVGMVMECEEAPLPAPPGVREEAGITRDSAAPNPPSAPVLPRVNYVLLRRAQVQPPPAPLPTPEPATLLLLGTGLLVLGWKAGGAH